MPDAAGFGTAVLSAIHVAQPSGQPEKNPLAADFR